MATKGEIIDWKHLWKLVSGIHFETPPETVQDQLVEVSQELLDGILLFKKSDSSGTDLECLLKEKKQEKLYPLTKKLQDLLDLESKQCWEILCFYLSNEYNGSANSLLTFVATDANMCKLLDDVWGYYTLERMIVLKIVKNMLTYYSTPSHPYYKEYEFMISKISLEKLRKSYLKQFEYLLKEEPSQVIMEDIMKTSNKVNVWAERNCREMNEILHIILLIVNIDGIEPEQLQKLFDCCKQHSFGNSNRYLTSSNTLHKELMRKISFNEVALFLRCIDFLNPKDNSDAKKIVELLEKDIASTYHNTVYGPVLLAWMLLNIRMNNDNEGSSIIETYLPFGAKALQLNVFFYLKELISHDMFRDDSTLTKIVRRTVYNNLSYLCDLFDENRSVSRQPFVYDLFCELLSSPDLAKEFSLQEENGVRSLFNAVLESFPIDFVNLSRIAAAITKGGQGAYMRKQLENLPIYTESSSEAKFDLEASNITDEYVLRTDYSPFLSIDYTIPAGTTAVIMDRNNCMLTHFRITVNYFDVLHNEINCLLEEAGRYTEFNTHRFIRVSNGLKYLKTAIEAIKSIEEIPVEMVHPTEMCIDILNKFKATQSPPVELLADCLNVCTELLRLVNKEIYTRVINLNILPTITNDSLDYKNYANGICFNSGFTGLYLVDVEKETQRYDFLLAYLRFIRAYAKLEVDQLFQVEIPGLVFLLREVLPHLHSWRFESQKDKNKIYAEVMGFICDILNVVAVGKDSQHAAKLLLRNICVYSLLNIENGLIILRFVGIGNPSLQLSMEMESNWMKLSSSSIIMLVRLSMRILMQILRLKTSVYASSTLSPLEALIYTQPKQRDTLKIIPVVMSYMNNIFDRWLPLLACRLLKRFAIEFHMSLLACLDMTPEQIRGIFFSKLPIELENDNLKIAILEFIEACIEKQPGITETLFNVNLAKDKSPNKRRRAGDSILTFMEDFLEAVEKQPAIVENPLLSQIMTLFHTLWSNNMQCLVTELINKPKFWSSLSNPLFSKFLPNIKVYAQLFNIFGIELFCNTSNPDPKLTKILNQFFDSPQFDAWLDYVFDLPFISKETQAVDDTPEWMSRLQAFKGFILIYLRKSPTGLEIPKAKMKLLAQKCFDTLVKRSSYVDDMRPFIILSEMYLFVILSYKHSYTDNSKEDQEVLHQLINLLNGIANFYIDLHFRAKEACLSIAIKWSDLLAGELIKDSAVAMEFLNSTVTIICLELGNMEKEARESEKDSKQTPNTNDTYSLILSLNLLKTIATIFHQDHLGNWDRPFINNKILNRLLSCTSAVLQQNWKRKLSVELLDVLIVLAKGNFSQEFLYCDVEDYLWLKLLPPKQLLQVNYNTKQPADNEWTVQKWWPIYSRGIELVTTLFHKNGYQFLKSALTFVGVHEEYLMDSLLLTRQSLEPNAIELIKNAVLFLAKLVDFEKEWRLEHSHSLFNLMRCVQGLMEHTISMYHQPNNVKSLVTGRRNQMDAEKDGENLFDDVVEALNNLTEILALCAKCLLAFSPPLLELICEPEFLAAKWEPLFEVHFGAPKLNSTSMQPTFGTVLGAISILTKVLNTQNYGFNEVPLNTIPENVELENQNVEVSTRGDQTKNLSESVQRRRFSKSVSVTSVCSASTAPNELLTILDGELCSMALEYMLMLIASQSLLLLKNSNLPAREKQLIRREISTELISYHEYVRKKVLVDVREYKSIWHRRKHGIAYMTKPHKDDDDKPTGSPKPLPQNGTKRPAPQRDSMRINVVRRLHLEKQAEPEKRLFETSQMISPIAHPSGSKSKINLVSSTPNLARPSIHGTNGEPSANNMRIDSPESDEDQEEEEEIEMLPPEDPKYCPFSYVQIVEEDYLHFMSNLFAVICQSD